jgi:hypothetical protein
MTNPLMLKNIQQMVEMVKKAIEAALDSLKVLIRAQVTLLQRFYSQKLGRALIFL